MAIAASDIDLSSEIDLGNFRFGVGSDYKSQALVPILESLGHSVNATLTECLPF